VRYLFCSLDSPGFLFPALAIARELRRRSHEVAFVTGPTFAHFVQDSGFERIPRGEQDGKSFQIEIFAQPLEMVRQARHVEYALGRFHADVLVGQQLALGPLLAGERQGLPVASLGLASYIFPVTDGPPGPEMLARRAASLHDGLLARFNEAREAMGLRASSPRYRETPLIGDLLMLRSVPELEGDVASLPERVRLVGDCLWEPPEAPLDPALEQWLEEARASGLPLFYVQPARDLEFCDFWPLVVEALKDMPARVVAAIRKPGVEEEQFPPHFLVRRHVPQSSILRQARGIIASGTTTVVLGALTHSVPALLLVAGGEQFSTSERCRRAGAALSLLRRSDDDLTPRSIRAAVEELLATPSLARNAGRLREALARVDGPARAADLLEELGHLRQRVPRANAS
jgi:UDP:flavonoid glycosyltransferase YjiC (YdhE family)